MFYNVNKLNDIALDDKKVILRLDLNVPIKNGKILDDNRIRAAIPTINYLLDKNAKIIILSHLGRIKSIEDKESIDKSLKPIYDHLKILLPDTNIYFESTQDEKNITKASNELNSNEILILENTRFYDIDKNGKSNKLESKNDNKLGKFWASLGDVFINDAFGTAHRSHASNIGIAKNIKVSAIGLLIEKELNMLSQACDNPEKPLIAVLGGAKIADKIKTIEKISKNADKILIGGGMAYTFLKAKGVDVGKSLVDDESIDIAKKFINELNDKLILPIDHVCSSSIEGLDKKNIKVNQSIPENMMALDIGKKTIKLFNSELKNAKTIIWNGPLGLFENYKFSNGTKKVCKQIAKLSTNGAFTLIGGGDSASAAIQFGFANSFTHISTGGGASLAYLEGEKLPGIESLVNNKTTSKTSTKNNKVEKKNKTETKNSTKNSKTKTKSNKNTDTKKTNPKNNKKK